MELSIFCDGGARGNPGPAAAAFVVKSGGKIIHQHAEKIGKTTNNVAEYRAVVAALEWLKKSSIINPQSSINFFLDSQLVVNQLNGFYKIKDAKLRLLIIEVKGLEQEVGGKIFYRHIPRTENKLADFLVNKVLSSESSFID